MSLLYNHTLLTLSSFPIIFFIIFFHLLLFRSRRRIVFHFSDMQYILYLVILTWVYIKTETLISQRIHMKRYLYRMMRRECESSPSDAKLFWNMQKREIIGIQVRRVQGVKIEPISNTRRRHIPQFLVSHHIHFWARSIWQHRRSVSWEEYCLHR